MTTRARHSSDSARWRIEDGARDAYIATAEGAKIALVDSMAEPDDGPAVEMTSATAAPPFELEAPLEPGKVPERVIDELRTSFRIATDYAGAFSDALRAQAEKHRIHPKALRRYIVALEGDKVGDAKKELDDLERLLDGAGVVGTADA